jgi:hypothetical protein
MRGARVIKLQRNSPSYFTIFDNHKQIHRKFYESLPSFLKLAYNYWQRDTFLAEMWHSLFSTLVIFTNLPTSVCPSNRLYENYKQNSRLFRIGLTLYRQGKSSLHISLLVHNNSVAFYVIWLWRSVWQLKMEELRSFERADSTHPKTKHHTPEDRNPNYVAAVRMYLCNVFLYIWKFRYLKLRAISLKSCTVWA